MLIRLSSIFLFILVGFMNCGRSFKSQYGEIYGDGQLFKQPIIRRGVLRGVSRNSKEVTQRTGWFMEARQGKNKELFFLAQSEELENQSIHDTFGGAYIGTNAWALSNDSNGAGANLTDAFVRWDFKNSSFSKPTLQLSWYMGGFHRNYGGVPDHGWDGSKGANNVKAYPRLGIGSASGQPVASFGVPNNVPTAKLGHDFEFVDQQMIASIVQIPSRVYDLPPIDIHIDLSWVGGYEGGFLPANQKFGNFFSQSILIYMKSMILHG